MNTPAKVVMKKGEVLKVSEKMYPGSGAIEYAKTFIPPKMPRDFLLFICREIDQGRLNDPENKRVRRCNTCGYYFEDTQTRNNSALTCSKECKDIKDTILKTYHRRVKTELSGTKRKPFKDGRYADGEYPFWVNDRAMFESDRKHFITNFNGNIDYIIAKSEQRELIGGKKRNTSSNHLMDEKWAKPKKHLSKDFYGTTNATGGQVTFIKRTREEIEADLIERYGEQKMAQERRRARYFSHGHKA